MQIHGVLFVVGAVLGGCGGMMTGAGGMHEAVADATTEDQAHASAAFAATTMSAMLDESTRHTSRMGEILDDMAADMGMMRHCSGVPEITALRDEMHAELDAHGETMRIMANLDGARTEVGHHVAVMGSMLHDMDSMLDGMRCSGW